MLAKRTRRRSGADSPASPMDLDGVIHERVRLGIVAALAASDVLTFKELKGGLDLTDGNLSVHTRRLEEVGYLVCTKGYDGRVPRTEYKLTAAGRRALDKYVHHMEALIQAIKQPSI